METPYQVHIVSPDLDAQALPVGGGVENSDTPATQEINRARMEHLESLGLPIAGKSVLDVGCGAGRLAQFFVEKNCRIACIDAREENIRSLHEHYPALEAYVANVETDLFRFGAFDIVFSYDLLSRLEDPIANLSNMAAVCKELLLLETMVCDYRLPAVLYSDEARDESHAPHTTECRPSPSFVALMLSRAGFPFVYAPAQPPQHQDFQVEWMNSLQWRQNGHPIRCVFVASRTRIENANLVPLIENPAAAHYVSAASAPAPAEADLVESEIAATAQSLAYVRPLVPYPGWHFDIEWNNPDMAFEMRRKVWSYYRDRQLEAPFLLRWYYDLRVLLYLGNDLSKQLFVGGCYDPNEFAWLNSVLTPGMVFVDAGANDGLYTLFAARKVGENGTVWAFEPSDREFQRLCQNVQANELRQVRPFRVALSDRDGTAELRIAGAEHAGQNTLGDFMYKVPLLRKQQVELRSLDSLVRERALSRVDILKLDVEGAEQRVLWGAQGVLRNMRPTLLFELADSGLLRQGTSARQLLDFLRSFDYAIYCFDKLTGQPVRPDSEEYTNNVIAVPAEKLPATA